MKAFYAITLSILFGITIIAKPIPKEQAAKVANSFLESHSMSLTYQEKAHFLPDTSVITLFYIFNDSLNHSFVIVAGDDASYPILGYSKESLFNTKIIGSNVEKWIDGYKKEIRYIIREKLLPTDDIKNEWNFLLDVPTRSLVNIEVVAPLLKTKWNQSPYYNALCPYDYSLASRSVSGCVATAMAQVMKYWNHPSKGVGIHSYVHPKYGTLSANFSITNYNWSNMPNLVTSSNNDVATLMYHCGVSVDMDYSPSGSGAWTISQYSPNQNCSEYAFKNYFDYSTSSEGLARNDYSESTWISMLKSDLDYGRPIIYTGQGSGGGHAFVCDGYDASNFFHFNWGWGGLYDGYFKVGALNPGAGGTGSGSGAYNQYQTAIFYLEPKPTNNTPKMELEFYSALTVNPSPIIVNGDYSFTFNVVNQGTDLFKGDIIGVLTDENYNIVDITNSYTENNGLKYDYHYTQNKVFSGSISDTVLPGIYYAIILARPLGGNWDIVKDGSFSNFIPVNITTENSIVMYKPIVLSSQIVKENQPISVNFDVLNEGADFKGDFSLDLHTVEGAWIKVIGESTNNTLPSNYHFTNGLNFSSNDGFGVPPGTYQLLAWSKPTGGAWEQIKSSGTNNNPIKIIVAKPELTADLLEMNNTKITATRIPYLSEQEYKYTTAKTSIHNNSDIDYYKLDLPAGSTYFIDARIQDGEKNNNGKTYTLDAMWNYSIGNLTSDTYDDINVDGSIIVDGGQTIYFAVYPYFQGKVGTYDFELSLSKSIPKDKYEDNNNSENAYIISNDFSGISKVIKLTGATFHSISDNDYYKISSKSDVNFSIVPFIRDKNYMNDANYTIDGQWSYSLDGTNWSSWMDGSLTGVQSLNISINNSLYVRVKPKNLAEMGSYALEFKIDKYMDKDQYEINDSQSFSSTLYASFLNNNAIVTTQNSTISTDKDIDFYKIELTQGYTYSIDYFISDLVATNDGKSYSIDAKFSFSSDGTVWSPYYDNSYNLFNITADKPKVLYIKVIPSKPNTIGTYKLSANITRNTISNVEDQLVSGCKFISLSDGFTIITDGNTIINNFSIYSQNGKLHSTYNNVDKEITIHNLPSGLYHLQINTNNGSWKEQILSIQ